MLGEVFMSYEEVNYLNDSLEREWRNASGKYHREDGPAVICYYPDGSIKRECFFINGQQHRELAPAVICYYPDGSIKAEYFYINGKPHRELGPADIYYNEYGSINDEWFYLDGRFFGLNKKGFWKFWDLLNHDQRQKPELLKYLAKFS
jgi:antitoxin component YwqK of YwqJK toxin-antitoxin module